MKNKFDIICQEINEETAKLEALKIELGLFEQGSESDKLIRYSAGLGGSLSDRYGYLDGGCQASAAYASIKAEIKQTEKRIVKLNKRLSKLSTDKVPEEMGG